MLCVNAVGEWEWLPATEQLDKSLLMARDPILFYDEIPLYESELDDNGVSQLLVKVPSPCPDLTSNHIMQQADESECLTALQSVLGHHAAHASSQTLAGGPPQMELCASTGAAG